VGTSDAFFQSTIWPHHYMMHKLAIAIWHVLHDHVPYQELGADHFTKRDPERAMRRMTREANSLGLTIRFDPIATA
jgi:hypothetical protein